jgi:transcriptional regulator with XRE-family HTH domain
MTAEPSKMNTELEGWRRLGEKVRQARIDNGYTNQEAFAEECLVSVRVLSDLESGRRTNFSDRVLSRLEEGLGWPAGTMDQIVADPTFDAPGPVRSGDLMFRPPIFDRRPVHVEVAAAERAIAALTEASRSGASGETVSGLGAALVSLCWSYVIRLVEDNCLPGHELHPGVRPYYEMFAALASEHAPNDPVARYAKWLAGDASDATEPVRPRYHQRASGARRRAARGRRARRRPRAE